MISMRDNKAAIDGLAERGWAVLPGYFPSSLTELLRADLSDCVAVRPLKLAGTGRSGIRAAEPVRTDRTLWLDGSTWAQQEYLALMEALRLDLNRALYLGLFDYECHYALYAPGGFYKKHIDSLRGTRNRLVSCVTYLTPDWVEADKGHLALYDPQDETHEIARILPESGTLALFLSEEIPHEVLPPARERASIAGWFRCAGLDSKL